LYYKGNGEVSAFLTTQLVEQFAICSPRGPQQQPINEHVRTEKAHNFFWTMSMMHTDQGRHAALVLSVLYADYRCLDLLIYLLKEV